MAHYNYRECPCGSGLDYYELKDGYGAFLVIACDACKEEKLAYYRPDMMTRYERPSWFAVHMEDNPADPDEEWKRLNRAGRNDYDRDDISSAIMIEGLRSAFQPKKAAEQTRE